MTATGGILYPGHFLLEHREGVDIPPLPSQLLDSESRCSEIYRKSVMMQMDVLMTDTMNSVRKAV